VDLSFRLRLKETARFGLGELILLVNLAMAQQQVVRHQERSLEEVQIGALLALDVLMSQP
jgi:hypothetical protein